MKALTFAPERPRLGYDRSLFPHWSDLDRDGCDTREEVLISESFTPAQVDPSGCRVVAGDWLSPYDGRRTNLPRDLDVDHVVALAEAWDSGADGWDTARRQAFANDLENPVSLIAVTSAANRSKGDEDPAQWQPPRREAWCSFATDWVTVKIRWGLSADAAEVRALEVLLKACPGTGPSHP
ncbi:MAG: HNH endonuclease family protein [Actinomycetota bacterium]|nr:HNH endonuclease family protein [Actinomycetota bacterium]